jgi:MFS family permease
MWVSPVRDQRSFSAWFERSVDAVELAVRRVGLLLVVMWLLLGALGWGLIVATFDSDRGRELRRLLDIDQTIFGPSRSSAKEDLTSAEAERAWELLRGLFWSALPWLVVLVLAFVIAAAWSVALIARAVHHHVVGPADPVEDTRDELANIAGDALRRVPAVLASGLVVLLLFAGAWLLAAWPVVVVAAADGGAAAIVLTVVFVLLLVAVVTAWLWGRLMLASVLAAVGGHGLGVRRGWDLTHGRFWFVFLRLLVAGLIASVASGVANVVNTFGQIFDFAVYLAIVFLLQAVAIAVSMTITVCAHLVTVDQIDDAHQVGH